MNNRAPTDKPDAPYCTAAHSVWARNRQRTCGSVSGRVSLPDQSTREAAHWRDVGFAAISRRTASAFSASDIVSPAIITSAVAKSVAIGADLTSGVSTPPTEAASARGFRRFFGSLVQAVVQSPESVAATSDRLSLGTLRSHVRDVEAAGSIPVIPT